MDESQIYKELERVKKWRRNLVIVLGLFLVLLGSLLHGYLQNKYLREENDQRAQLLGEIGKLRKDLNNHSPFQE
jgi:hypothetical protein